ncbi:MAG: glycosyltransferase family 39 protein [Burkholderiales bacterium]|nr:glycosyltransferase family 39 protein [Burkholderiales bacterium]
MTGQLALNLNRSWWCLIILLLLINACGMFSPVLNSNDAYFYAVISKTMVSNHDWLNLYYASQDWLDKPHLPFWLTALSFKIFGISAFAYVLPGFIFHCVGAIYTYRLGKVLYSEATGIAAALIYVSSLHLLLSSMDIRAEAFLLGEIVPACYYYLRYDRVDGIKNLLLASLFTGLALMTKGLFIVVTIFSGLVAMWLYSGELRKIIQPKWLLAYALSLLAALPELICLYVQFDLHPEKLVFGQQQVSGISWFFWGSQFGRFFNSGPIVNNHGNPGFFVHTFLWAFLPWSLLFIGSIFAAWRRFKTENATQRAASLYLQSGFWLTFIMFSATKFQLDHYTNIIMPFAAIMVANYILNQAPKLAVISKIQQGLTFIILCLSLAISIFFFRGSWLIISALIPTLILGYCIFQRSKISVAKWILTLPALAVASSFIVLMLVNAFVYRSYDAGYNIAQYLKDKPAATVYNLEVPGLINNLEFHSELPVAEAHLPLPNNYPYYLAIKNDNLSQLESYNYEKLARFNELEMTKFIPAMLSSNKYQYSLIMIDLVKVNGRHSN